MIALAKEKDCELVGEWKRSLLNHLYWSAVSTPDGNGEVIQAKWMSLDNHIHNKNQRHGKNFPKCSHGRLRRRRKKSGLNDVSIMNVVYIMNTEYL